MARFSVDISDELNDWLIRQAALNRRSKNKQLEHILETVIKASIAGPRYIANSPKMCYNGQHYFVKADPAMSDYCNCGVFIFGEVVR